MQLAVAAVRAAKEMTSLTGRDQAMVVPEHLQCSPGRPFFMAVVVAGVFTDRPYTPREPQELAVSVVVVPAMATSPRLVRRRPHLVRVSRRTEQMVLVVVAAALAAPGL